MCDHKVFQRQFECPAIAEHMHFVPAGDPIEVGAAVSVLQPPGSTKRLLLLTGLKSELGHAEPAAGVLGLARLAAQVRQRLTRRICMNACVLHTFARHLLQCDACCNTSVPKRSTVTTIQYGFPTLPFAEIVGRTSVCQI
jgi:hypothetical protein